jgi:excisionase family DNA binding protein
MAVRATVHLTVKEAAPLLGGSESRVRYLIKTKSLPAEKVGRRWQIDSEDVAHIVLHGVPEPVPQQHDKTRRLLFSFPEMVEDLLRGFFDEPWLKEVDFSTLKRAGGSYVSDRLDARWSDVVWTV